MKWHLHGDPRFWFARFRCWLFGCKISPRFDVTGEIIYCSRCGNKKFGEFYVPSHEEYVSARQGLVDLLNAGVMTVNEVRAELDMNELPTSDPAHPAPNPFVHYEMSTAPIAHPRLPQHPACKCSCHTDVPTGSFACNNYGCQNCQYLWQNEVAPHAQHYAQPDLFGKRKIQL